MTTANVLEFYNIFFFFSIAQIPCNKNWSNRPELNLFTMKNFNALSIIARKLITHIIVEYIHIQSKKYFCCVKGKRLFCIEQNIYSEKFLFFIFDFRWILTIHTGITWRQETREVRIRVYVSAALTHLHTTKHFTHDRT